jgi:hypothetical protein
MKQMKNMNRYMVLAVFGGMLTFHSCETTDLDITANPNALTPDQASVDFFLSSIQEDFIRQFEGTADFDPNDNYQSGGVTLGDGFNELGMQLTRLLNMSGRNYNSVYQASDMSDEWTNAYLGILADIRAMTPLAEEAGLNHHLGISQFVEAYLMVTMVDFFGDVPYSEAIQGEAGNFNPKTDPGADIYARALALLDLAIANFNGEAAVDPAQDFFYGGDFDKWVLAANTLKMKIYVQSRLVDGSAIANFNTIVSSGNYIQSTADDFQYNWPATSPSQPDTRHPRYGLNYTASGAGDYMSNWLMNEMDITDDPRIRYYFYRQTDATPGGGEIPPDEQTLVCSLQAPPAHYVSGGYAYCSLPNGYWGRDHGDDEGTPPDGLLRTTWGTYPAGGKFDDSSFEGISATSGAGGKGVTVLLSAFNVDFMQAEIAMVQGQTTVARDFMLTGFDKQMAKVQAFLLGLEAGADTSFEPSSGDITAYRQGIGDDFDAGSMADKWNILGEQFLIANYGNGVEPYNFYRRTLYPSTLQPNREPNPGTFIMSMYYPSIAVNNNSSISQKSDQAQPVFWDNSGVPTAN